MKTQRNVPEKKSWLNSTDELGDSVWENVQKNSNAMQDLVGAAVEDCAFVWADSYSDQECHSFRLFVKDAKGNRCIYEVSGGKDGKITVMRGTLPLE